MKNLVFAALLVGSSLGVVACGKGLNGTYVKCVQISTSTSKLATYIVPDSSNFSYQSVIYQSSDCEGTPNPQPSAAGTYIHASSTVSGAQSIDFKFASGAQSGTTLYQVYKIDGNNLFLGDVSGTNNGSTADLRPTVLEATPYFKQ